MRNANIRNRICQLLAGCALLVSTANLQAAEIIVEVTVETMGRLLEQHPIAELAVRDQAQTDKLTLLTAAHENGSTVTITLRELEHDPPRTKVVVLTDTPVNATLAERLTSTIATIAARE